jgi:hypothetical protein
MSWLFFGKIFIRYGKSIPANKECSIKMAPRIFGALLFVVSVKTATPRAVLSPEYLEVAPPKEERPPNIPP